jgi:hypothetical protein
MIIVNYAYNGDPAYSIHLFRINYSIFTGVKYAEIYLTRDPIGVPPRTRIYGLTWSGLNRKITRWLNKDKSAVEGAEL